MKNKSKILIGSFLSAITFCLAISFANISDAHAQNELTQEGDELYKPTVCYSGGVHYAQCVTPEKQGACARIVKCP
jgi:hypothetical protein